MDGRSILVGALLAAVVVNVAEFGAIEGALSGAYVVRTRYPDTDLPAVTRDQGLTVRNRFELYVTLAESASGATLTIPAGTGLNRESLYGLGRLGQIVVDDDLEIGALPDLTSTTVGRGENRDVGPYVIAVADVPAGRLVAVQRDGTLYLLDLALLGDGADPDTHVPADA